MSLQILDLLAGKRIALGQLLALASPVRNDAVQLLLLLGCRDLLLLQLLLQRHNGLL